MAAKESIVAIDIGASSIKLGEFEVQNGASLQMINFGFSEYQLGGDDDQRFPQVTEALAQIREENNIQAKVANVSISVQMAFTKFVKLPPVDGNSEQLAQIIEFEAKQNVPFDLNEVIWDHQVIGNSGEELNVMFVAVKKEIAEQVCAAVQAAGFQVANIEIATSSCYNASRANRIGRENCAMVLSIGSRSSNLIFCDGDKLFSRNIPIAGLAITQQISKEFGIGIDEAEDIKRRHGFVALGGAYEEPESEVAATVSKIIRNVMTRLHGEINRSINIYKSQQKGNQPEVLYLCGGSSTMFYTEEFFREKIKCDVKYLNPFQSSIKLSSSIDKGALAEKGHLFSEIVGLALKVAACPVEISLLPDSMRKAMSSKAKDPFFYAASLSLLLIPVVLILASIWERGQYTSAHDKHKDQIQRLESIKTNIQSALESEAVYRKSFEELNKLTSQKYAWVSALKTIEDSMPSNVWIKSITPKTGEVAEITAITENKPTAERGVRRRGFDSRRRRSEQLKAQKSGPAKQEDIGAFTIEAYYVTNKGESNEAAADLFVKKIKESDVFLDDADNSQKTGLSSFVPIDILKYGYFEAQLALIEPIRKAGH